MAKLPQVTGREAVRAFIRAGYREDRVKGSHHILVRDEPKNTISVPVHAGRNLGVGLLKGLIDSAGLTEEEFVDLL